MEQTAIIYYTSESSWHQNCNCVCRNDGVRIYITDPGKTYPYRNLGFVRNDTTSQVGKRVAFRINIIIFQVPNQTRHLGRIWGDSE